MLGQLKNERFSWPIRTIQPKQNCWAGQSSGAGDIASYRRSFWCDAGGARVSFQNSKKLVTKEGLETLSGRGNGSPDMLHVPARQATTGTASIITGGRFVSTFTTVEFSRGWMDLLLPNLAIAGAKGELKLEAVPIT
jgi:hypothetical protein